MNLEKLSIAKLIVYNAVAHFKSMAIAARVLKIPLLKVHNEIKSIERVLGVPLLMRNQRKIHLTEAGQKVAEFALSVIDALHNVKSKPSHELPQDLIIAAPHGFCETFLAPVLLDFNHTYPDVSIKIFSGSDNLDFTNKDFDIIIGDHLSNRADLTQSYIFSDNFCLYASKKYLSNHEEPKSIADLKNHQFLHYLGHPYPLEKISKDITAVIEINNFETIARLIKEGMGIGLLRKEKVLADASLETQLQSLFYGRVWYRQKFMFITRKFNHKSILIDFFHNLIKLHIKEI